MTIYKIERESTAWQIINILHSTHTNVNALVLWLNDTERTITTIDLIMYKNGWSGIYTQLNNFNNAHGTWFANSWADYSDALTGAITSLQNINDVINQGLQNWYWDADTDKVIVSDISQTHRSQLATYIEQELE